jgi:Fe-S cluster assembly protein SufD
MDERQHYLSTFATLGTRRAQSQPASLQRTRKAAIDRFAELGFPSTQLEEWRFTNVAPIAHGAFTPAANGQLAPRALERDPLGAAAASRLVFVNGRYAPGLSRVSRLPEGVTAGSLAAVLGTNPEVVESHLARYAAYDTHAFVALNTAFIEDGAFIHIPDHAIVDDPIVLIFVSTAGDTASVSHPRSLIVAGTQSQATIVESHVAPAASGEPAQGVYFTNAVTELVVGPNAVIEHCKVQRESEAAFHVATLAAHQGRDSKLALHSISLGGALARHDVIARLGGEGAACVMNGLYMVGGKQLVDNHTTIDHAQPHSSSLETYKGVLDGAARAVFSGRIVVEQDAQKVDARQINKNLLLSEDAVVNTTPQLEISADDVKCSHGATVGMLEEDALFYLRSRGMDYQTARNLLIYAFVSDILGAISRQPLRDRLEELVHARLPGGQAFREGA